MQKLYFPVIVSLVALVGCSPSLPYQVVPFSGTLTYQGQPFDQEVILTFTPAEGRPSSAVVGADGKFRAEYTGTTSGVQTGKLIVTLGDARNTTLPGVPPAPPLLQEALKKYAFGTQGFEIEVTKKETDYKLDLP